MRWWRPDADGDGVDEEHVRRRLVRVVGGAAPSDPVAAVEKAAVEEAAVEEAAVAEAAVAEAAVEGAAVEEARSLRGDLGGADARAALAVFDPGRRPVRVLAVVALVVAVLVAALVWWSRPRAQPVAVEPEVPALSGAPAASGAAESGGVVVIAVAGRVNRPGLVRLPPGARVADAIEAAGGVQAGTDLGYINLARRVVDGELLVIGASAPPGAPGEPAGSGALAGPGGAVNLNTASLAQLDALPGVGPVLAQRIVDYRTRHGGFRSVADLRKVEGVGDARYAQLKDLVAV
jgi:competence protein ComEA